MGDFLEAALAFPGVCDPLGWPSGDLEAFLLMSSFLRLSRRPLLSLLAVASHSLFLLVWDIEDIQEELLSVSEKSPIL